MPLSRVRRHLARLTGAGLASVDTDRRTYRLEPEALAFHKEVSEEQVKVLYRGTGKTAYRA